MEGYTATSTKLTLGARFNEEFSDLRHTTLCYSPNYVACRSFILVLCTQYYFELYTIHHQFYEANN